MFSFCSIDIMGLIIITLSRIIATPFDDNPIVVLVFYNIGFGLFLYISIKLRKNYIQIQNTIRSGWKSIGAVSILFYILIYLITAYEVPKSEMEAYLIILIVFIITIIFVYIVIYQTVMKALIIHDEQKERELLETKIALQNSQLELKELYYKMAYTDAMTGLKNRAAF